MSEKKSGKLTRNTSTPELARWWANVEAVAREYSMTDVEKIEEAELRGAEWAFRFSLANLRGLVPDFDDLVRECAIKIVVKERSRS